MSSCRGSLPAILSEGLMVKLLLIKSPTVELPRDAEEPAGVTTQQASRRGVFRGFATGRAGL